MWLRLMTALVLILTLGLLSSEPAVGQTATPTPIGGGTTAEIVFTSDRTGGREIYVMDVAGDNERRLTNNGARDYYPRWSPDGDEIVFVSNRHGGREIYVMDADGENVRRLTDNNVIDDWPSWSPDGGEIVFVSSRAGGMQIFAMDASDGSDVRRLSSRVTDNFWPVWSPDGRWLAFESTRDDRFGEIYLMDVQTAEVLRVTDFDSTDHIPRWSPDGTRLSLVSTREGFEEIFTVELEAVLQNAPVDDLLQRQSPPGTGLAGSGMHDWSPDGTKMVVGARVEVDRQQGLYDENIYILDLQSGEMTQITDDNLSAMPDWRP